MATFAFFAAGSAIASLVGKGVLAQAVYDTSSVLINLARDTVYQEHPELSAILEELDIHATLQVIDSLLEEVPENYNDNKSLHTCIHNVNEIIEKIKENLGKINNEVEYHKTKYFNYWRTPQYETDVKKLKKLKPILDKRLKLFINVLKIAKK